ncbi:MAG TPA: DUF6051 family protein [Bacteroidales bacterium]|nr:hypothetical protein [Bacteroidales bacterium]HNR41376.1 DUF6051 family protein [Bacteroidales bacterium]HPM17500.1 DUF6051 family protein [Bacteroidales bacterium]
MDYITSFSILKSLYSINLKEVTIPGSELKILNIEFRSESNPEGLMNDEDLSITENNFFTYPVFVPPGRVSGKVVLLLHGLNERNWIKYLPWAYHLSVNTGSYVILFPISFHINRSPSSWINPRLMTGPVKERNDKCSDVRMSTYANIALSSRLSQDPMRFFHSGCQTAFDIIKLVQQIRSGNHEVIPAGSGINIFAYSIGAFLAQILVMGNPENLFTDSKLFMFCGGSVFSSMKGTSRLIMDSEAFNRIYNFYLDDFENEIRRKSSKYGSISESQLGMAFRSMIDFGRFRSFRDNLFEKLRGRIRSVALSRDSVIPAEGIVRTILKNRKPGSIVEVWDFPFEYSHENPFPVHIRSDERSVNSWFSRLFSEACLFLA